MKKITSEKFQGKKKKLRVEHREAGLAEEPQGRPTLPRKLRTDCPRPPDRLRASYAPALALASEPGSRGRGWRASTRKTWRSTASTCAPSLCATPPRPRCTSCPVRSRLTGPLPWSASSPRPSARVLTDSKCRFVVADYGARRWRCRPASRDT